MKSGSSSKLLKDPAGVCTIDPAMLALQSFEETTSGISLYQMRKVDIKLGIIFVKQHGFLNIELRIISQIFVLQVQVGHQFETHCFAERTIMPSLFFKNQGELNQASSNSVTFSWSESRVLLMKAVPTSWHFFTASLSNFSPFPILGIHVCKEESPEDPQNVTLIFLTSSLLWAMQGAPRTPTASRKPISHLNCGKLSSK